MERGIVGGVLATRAAPGILIRVVSRAFAYTSKRIWLRWSLAGLAVAVVLISCTHLWGYLVNHAVMLLLPLPVLLAGWLVVGAEQARQMQRPMRTCRRQ